MILAILLGNSLGFVLQMLFLPLEVLCKVTYPPECLPHQWIVLQEPGPRRAGQSSEQFSRVPVANAVFIPRWCEAGSQRLVSSSQIRLQMMTLPLLFLVHNSESESMFPCGVCLWPIPSLLNTVASIQFLFPWSIEVFCQPGSSKQAQDTCF